MAPQAEVFEPEVIPPGASGSKTAERTDPGGINPIVAGLIIDVLGMIVFGLVGFLAGGLIALYTARTHRLPLSLAALIGAVAGWYCALRLPTALPVATLVGLIIVLKQKWTK